MDVETMMGFRNRRHLGVTGWSNGHPVVTGSDGQRYVFDELDAPRTPASIQALPTGDDWAWSDDNLITF